MTKNGGTNLSYEEISAIANYAESFGNKFIKSEIVNTDLQPTNLLSFEGLEPDESIPDKPVQFSSKKPDSDILWKGPMMVKGQAKYTYAFRKK